MLLPHELAIIRYNNWPVEYIRGLLKRQVIGYVVEIPMVFLLLHADGRKHERFPCHLQTQGSHIPMARDNFCLLDFKVTSLVQVSQQTKSEFHGLREMTIKRCQPLLFAVDPHLAFHVMENAGYHGWRVKTGVWPKAQIHHVSLTARVAEHECIRQHLEQPPPLEGLSLQISPQFLLRTSTAH